jgi:hypothetical protein
VQPAVLVNIGRGRKLYCVAGIVGRGKLVSASVGSNLNLSTVGVGERTLKNSAELNGGTRNRVGSLGRGHLNASHGLSNDGATGNVLRGEHDCGNERRHRIGTPMVQEIVVAEGLRVAHRISLIKGVVATEEISGGEKRDAIIVRKRELVDDNLSGRDIGLLKMEQRGERIDVHGSGDSRGNQEDKLVRVGENRQVIEPNAVVLGARETEKVGIGLDGLQELLASLLVGRSAGKVMLIENEILLIECDELHHDAVLVVIIGVDWGLHNGADILSKSGIASECGVKLLANHRNVVTVATVLGVVPNGRIGSVDLEHVLCIIDIRVRLDPRNGDFLLGGTIEHLRGLETSKRILPLLGVNIGHADSVDENVGELVVITTVHRVEERLHSLGNGLLRSLRNSLLIVVGCVEPNGIENSGVVVGHFLILSVKSN